MNRILVVVFSEASKAFDGRDALKSLDHDGNIIAHSYAIIAKKADGTIVNEEDHHAGFSMLPGTSLRSMINRLGKFTESSISAAAESRAPGAGQDEARIGAKFVDAVSRQLTPGKFALVAEIEEEWTPWIDLRMEELGGVVYRCPLSDVKQAAKSEDIAAMKADLAQMRAEHARASADRKAKLLEKIDRLDSKIQQRLQKAKERHEITEAKDQARVSVLESKAARTREQLNPHEKVR